MIEAHKQMHLNSGNTELAVAELIVVKEYKMKHEAYLEFLRHKVKLDWLRDANENTMLFHQPLKARKE